jgi:serine protease inhibitor
VQTYYDAEIHPITTAEVINAWVDQKTRGRIDEIIKGAVPFNVVTYLINALYFKADWTYPIDAAETLDAPFHPLDEDRWREWMAEFGDAPKVEVRLPRFEMEWDTSLVAPLKAMGMQAPFEGGLADFSDMFVFPGPWIGEVLQKTFLRIDEKGTEAAAVTKVVMVRSATPRFTFDRPFFLAIYDHATETILFLGQVTDPTA